MPLDNTQGQDDWTAPSGGPAAAAHHAAPAPVDDWVTPAEVDDWMTPPDPGLLSNVASAAKAGVVQDIRNVAGLPATLRREVPKQPPAAQESWEQPLTLSDLVHPSRALPKITYQLAGSGSTLGAGIAGGIAGESVAPEGGGLVGGALAAGTMTAINQLTPLFAEEMQKPGADPDKAFNAALARAGQAGVFSGAGWAAFGVKMFEGPVKNLLFQAFGVQPGMAVAQRGVENVEQGKPALEGAGEAALNAVVGTAVPLAGTEAAHAALRLMRRPAPGTAPPESTAASSEPPGPSTEPAKASTSPPVAAAPVHAIPQQVLARAVDSGRGPVLASTFSPVEREMLAEAGVHPAEDANGRALIDTAPLIVEAERRRAAGQWDTKLGPDDQSHIAAWKPREAPPIPPTTPERPADIAAQVAAMADPATTKDAVFVAAGNHAAIPADLPEGTHVVRRPEGTLLTTNPEKAAQFKLAPRLTDAHMAEILGYPETKPEAMAAGQPVVVEAVNPNGAVVSAALADAARVPETEKAVAGQAPEGAKVEVVSPGEAQGTHSEQPVNEPRNAPGTPAEQAPGSPEIVGEVTPPPAQPSRAETILAELDARGAPDIDYREAFSTYSKVPLRPGETWRERLVKHVESLKAPVEADGKPSDWVAPEAQPEPVPETPRPPEPTAEQLDFARKAGETSFRKGRGPETAAKKSDAERAAYREGWERAKAAEDERLRRFNEAEEARKRAETQPPKTEAAAPKPTYGATNTTFTADAAEKARARLREKFNRLNSGLDPEMMLDGLTLAGFHIEAGARSFADYARAMVDDLGDGVRPYLRQFYEAVRWHPGFDTRGMSSAGEIETALKAPEEAPTSAPEAPNAAEQQDRDLDQPGSGEGAPGGVHPGEPEGNRNPDVLAPPPAEDVRGPDETGAGGETGVRPGHEAVPGEGALPAGGDATDGRGGAGEEGVAAAGAGGRKPQAAPVRPNFHVDDPARLIGGTPKVRFARNRAAIDALNAIQADQRAPTQEELEAMAGYTGWGSFGQDLFQGTFERPMQRRGWDDEAKWLRDTLGKQAWEDAQRSIINAHYTDPPTVKAMWDMTQRMGFRGGRVLEPSMGIGNFFGMMPRDVMANSALTGIELDRTTGSMAKLLYPQAGIHIKGYQESRTPDNFYDLVIGNWPFAAISPADRRYDRLSPTLHDYFFLKALDQTRPGGLVVGVTSAGTMDKAGRLARLEMAKKGDLVAAFRLPTGAFEGYAGTSVVTDILVFRKRAEVNPSPASEPWVDVDEVDTPNGEKVRVNNYFRDHPDAVLGTLNFGHGTTTGRPGMIVDRPADFAERLAALPTRVPEDGYQPVIRGSEPRFIVNNTTDRQNSVTVAPDGKLYQVQGERLVMLADVTRGLTGKDAAKAKATEAQVKGLVGIRRAYGALIDAERAGAPNTEDLRQELSKQFFAFRDKHGSLGLSTGLKLLDRVNDPAYSALAALERPDGTPARVLSEPTVRSVRKLENPSIADAYVIARNERSILDMDRVAEIAGRPRDAVEKHLLDSNAVLRTPGGGFEPKDQYLAGDVRRKLREAQEAAANGEDMKASIEALTQVLPATVPYYQIEAKLGAPWVGDDAYKAFVSDLLGLRTDRDRASVRVRFAGSRWKVRFADRGLNNTPEATTIWGHERYPFDKLVTQAMGNNVVRIMDPADSDGGPYFNQAATDEVNAKIQGLRERFSEWAWQDPERKIAFENAYNETMNAIAKPHYDGSFMDMSGMALRRGEDPFSLRRHQINAIWRGVIQGRGLFAHEVGTGKTYTMGGIAVEGRRYGVFRKPLILAHNANSASVAREIQDMYPGGRVLYIDNMAPDQVKTTMHRIANDDWDAVVMPHSLIDRMALTRETLNDLAADQIAELENEAHEAAREDGVEITPAMWDDPKELGKLRSVTAKDLVRQRMRIMANIDKQANRSSREDAIPFEKLGVDAVIVDEAHEFKKPPIATRMKLRGLNTETSDRSVALNFLTGYVKKNNNGRGVYLFTGTPVTNALNEIFNMSRYFMDDRLAQSGIRDWDTWFNTFADANTDVELTAAGTYEPVNRLASFVNVDELVRLMSEYTDVVQAKQMPEFVSRATPSGKTLGSPDLTAEEQNFLENGQSERPEGRPYKKIVTDVAEMSERQAEILDVLREYSQDFKSADGRQRVEWMRQGDPRSPVLVETAASNAGIDPRLYDPDAPDTPNSKINRVVRNVLKHYQEPKAAQVVFVDRGYAAVKSSEGRRDRFVLIRDMVNKLVEGGIPKDQIAVVAGGVSAEGKKEIADAMNDGRLRVVIGQSGTLGVGVNMQVNLRAMHHMDAPWRPGDLEQRNGRGERQGNRWNTVLEYRYVTEGIDGRRWQVLTAKDKFIKQFIGAFNDESGRRLGNIEGDAADISDNEDILKTLSAAAGDPRIAIREKYRVDVDRLERRERLHTIGVADAAARAREIRNRTTHLTESIDRGSRRIDQWEAAEQRAEDAAREAGDKRRWYEATANGKQVRLGQEIQDAIDEQVKVLHPGDDRVLATINGFDVVADWTWPPIEGVPHEPKYRITDAAGRVDGIPAPTMPRITAAIRGVRDDVEGWRRHLAEMLESVPRLEAAAKEDFPQREALNRKRQQLANLEDDLQANPIPPPGWLRHGAPIGSDIYVNGQPRTVQGHRMGADYTLVTDEGEVPYLQARDVNGARIFEVHAPPAGAAPVPSTFEPHQFAAAPPGSGYGHLAVTTNDETIGSIASRLLRDTSARVPQISVPTVIKNLAGKLDKDTRERALAGPRGGQRPADEGLFAARGVEQKPLFHRQVPLHSAVARAVDGLKQARGTGEQMLAQIAKTPGVKPDEVKWLGLDDFLRGQKSVTKEQIADYVRANALDVREVTYGDKTVPRFGIVDQNGNSRGDWRTREEAEDYLAHAPDFIDSANSRVTERREQVNPGRYASYQLPGGENYRELLITLPPKTQEGTHGITTENWMQHYDPAAGGARGPDVYRSSHWDEPNVLAHVRFSDRVGADGKRTLLVEEAQSDWHQAGRKKGYGPEQITMRERPTSELRQQERQVFAGAKSVFEATAPDGRRLGIGRTEADAMAHAERNRGRGVPDAPFKTTWPSLIMKRMLAYAVEHGYDRLAWTPGEQQAERYDLSKQVDRIVYRPDAQRLSAYKNDHPVIDQQDVPREQLADHIGKEAADRILNNPSSKITRNGGEIAHVLSGDDLRVGGSGMRTFYDDILPKETNKIVGKFGAKVGRSEVRVPNPYHGADPADFNTEEAREALKREPEFIGQPVHSIDLTPALKSAVSAHGLPLFQRPGAEQPHPAALRTIVANAQRIVGPHVRIEVHDHPSGGLEVTAPDGTTDIVSGMTLGRLIRAALDPNRTHWTLSHEAVHALENLGVLTDREWDTLNATADRENWAGRYGIADRYGDLSPDLQREEAIAERFADFVTNPPAPGTFMARVADAFHAFLERIRNVLAGHGFRTADDVFGAMQRGEVGAREPLSGGPGRGPQSPELSTVALEQWHHTRDDVPNLGWTGDPFGRNAAGTPSYARLAVPAAIKTLAGRLDKDTRDRALAGPRDFVRALFPMTAGSKEAQSFAFRFAKALRGIQLRFGTLDRAILKEFTPEQRSEMGRALDRQSVFEQDLRDDLAAMPAGDRAAYEADARSRFTAGLDSLPKRMRDTAFMLNDMSQHTWERMRDRSMVRPTANGLPFYMPRQFVMVEDGKARRLTPQDATTKGKAGEGGMTAMEPVGVNLTTRGPMRRAYRTPEESEAAAKARFGSNATMVTDIRSLVHALSRNERAIAGRDLVDAIKKYGEAAGRDLVSEGTSPGRGWFTLDHPALRTWAPALKRLEDGSWEHVKDSDGNPVFHQVDIHVSDDFKGPLQAVLTRPTPEWFKALMKIKGGVMHAVMYSPLIHLSVEMGRAFPMMRGRTFTLGYLRDGARAINDPVYMKQAVADGVAPIGQGWSADPSSIMDDVLEPMRRGKVSGALIGARDAIAAKIGKALGPQAEEFAKHPYAKILWDNVFRLQMGIYKNLSEEFERNGFDPRVAGTMAAHIANRYAGALPPEHLARWANMAANIGLFSRSFTLGNLGVIKDVFHGAPSHVLAEVERLAGPQVAADAKTALRRKALSNVVTDIGVSWILNATLQTMFRVGLTAGALGLVGAAKSAFDDWLDGTTEGLNEIAQGNPLGITGVLPQEWNEPGRTDRALVGTDETGRAYYWKSPAGRIGDEFLGWMTHPGELVKSKLSTFVRPLVEDIAGKDTMGRDIYSPVRPHTLGELISAAGRIVGHLVNAQLPVQSLEAANDLLHGRNLRLSGIRLAGQMTGLGQPSQGYPTGPQGGVEHEAAQDREYRRQQALPVARQQMADGDRAAAEATLRRWGFDERSIALELRSIANPVRGQVRAARSFNRQATPEQRSELNRTNTGAPIP